MVEYRQIRMGRKAFPRTDHGINIEVRGKSFEQTWKFYELQGKGSVHDSRSLEKCFGSRLGKVLNVKL